MPQYKHILTDFKDLRKVIGEVSKATPAKSREQQQAEKMGVMNEAPEAKPKDDKGDRGIARSLGKKHAGEEEIKKAYMALGRSAQGSVEFQRKLIQKMLAKMGYKTYSKMAFDTIFNRPLTKEDLDKFFTITESFTNKQLKGMRRAYKGLGKVDPTSPTGKKLLDKFKGMSKDELLSLAGAGINFLSLLAAANLISRFGMKSGDFKFDRSAVHERVIRQGAGMSRWASGMLSTMQDLLVKRMSLQKISKEMGLPMTDVKTLKKWVDDINNPKSSIHKEEVVVEGGMKRIFTDIDQGDSPEVIAKRYKLDIKYVKQFFKDVEKVKKAPRLRAAQNDPMKEGIDENKLSDLLIDIQQGATAKELARDHAISLAAAKNFLKDYYASKKGSRKEEVEEANLQEEMIQDFEIRFGNESDWKKADKLVQAYLRIHVPKHAKALLKKTYVHGPDPLMVAFGDTKQKLKPPVNLNKLYNTIRKLSSSRMKYWQAIPKKQEQDAIGESIQEGTWKLPKSSSEKRALKDLMKKPIKLGKEGDDAVDTLQGLIGDDLLFDDLYDAGKKNRNGDAREVIKKHMKRLGIREESREDKLKEEQEHAKQSPFKLKSQAYPRAIAINTDGFGHRHATVEDIIAACDSFGMIIDKELQVEQIQKQLGKKGFISFKQSDLEDVFESRETERMILALESELEEQEPIEYTQGEIAYAKLHEHDIEFLKPDGRKTVGPVLKVSGNTFNVKDKYTGKSFTYKYRNNENVKIEEGEVKTFKQVTETANVSILVTQEEGNIGKAVNKFDQWLKFSQEGPSDWKVSGSKDKISMLQKYIDTGKLGKSSYDKWPNEEVIEGKYLKYSDLLLAKGRAVDKYGPDSKVVQGINRDIKKEMQRLGINEDLNEVQLGPNMLRKDFPNVWATKDSAVYRVLNTLIIRDGFTTLLTSYKKDRKAFVDDLKAMSKSDALMKRGGFGPRDIKYVKNPTKGQSFAEDIQEGRFSKQLIKQAGGIAFDKRYYMGNMTGAVKAIEKLKKGLSDDPKVREMLRIANESDENLTALKFASWLPEGGDSEAYQKFFKKALKKFGVNSPDELEGEKKRKFFNYVDSNWKGDHEEKEIKLDGRKKNFREKMKKLGYIKGN